MRKPLALLAAPVIPLWLLLIASPMRVLAATAASFDCRQAKTPRETFVCSDAKLSALDGDLGHAYTALRAALSPAAASAVASDQREWLGWIDRVCSPAAKGYRSNFHDCLTDEYTSRLKQLTEGHRSADGLVLYPRAHYVLAVHKPGTEPYASNDPGFGTGSFSWPQIDTPTDAPDANAAAWNKAVLAAALQLAATDEVHSPTTFDSTVDDADATDTFYRLRAFNRHLLVVDLGNSTYGYGAAHPNTGISGFSWWLDRGRKLTASDVFNPAANWQTKVVELVSAKVKARGLLSDSYASEADTHKTIVQTVNSVDAWTLSSSGLTVTFDVYALAGYALGMPSFRLSWAELKPYLAPTLNIGELPALIPIPHP